MALFRLANSVASLVAQLGHVFGHACKKIATQRELCLLAPSSPQMMGQHLEAHALEGFAFVFVEGFRDAILCAAH